LAVIILVVDSLGIGALPDAGSYQDEGSNTFFNMAQAAGGLTLPSLSRLGIGNIAPAEGVVPAILPEAAYGRMVETSAGKDTTTGHWELMGLILDQPFPVYPTGFPRDIIAASKNVSDDGHWVTSLLPEPRSLPSWVNGTWPQVTLLYTHLGTVFFKWLLTKKSFRWLISTVCARKLELCLRSECGRKK